jgi:SpoVK/Ycf46/Vps4 family AAA+-type ATPase
MENKQGIGIIEYLKAGYSHYYIQTDQLDRAIKLLKEELLDYKDSKGAALYNDIAEWGITPPPSTKGATKLEDWEPNPMNPLVELEQRAANAVVILKNYHWFMRDAHGQSNYEVVQFLQDRLILFRGQSTRRIVIVVAPVNPVDGLPREISREFISLRLGLPGKDEIRKVLDKSISAGEKKADFKKLDEGQKVKLVDSAVGLTLQEAENAFFYSMVKTKGSIDSKIVTDIRMKYLQDVAGVKYIAYKETFDTLLGYDRMKDIARKLIPNPKAKGMLILGPAGTGKSHFGKACSGEFGIPMLTIEMAEMFSKWYGETGHRVNRVIDAIKAFGRVIVFVDEIEKGLAGAGSGSASSGQAAGHEETQRALAQWLKFMQDHEDGIFFVATCNNIWGLPPEYIRAERWDTAPFFVDLPVWEEREMILAFYKDQYKVKGELTKEETEGWSGAELKSVCRLADIMGSTIDKTKDLIVPVSETMKEAISELRTRCAGRTIRASRAKLDKGWTADRAIDF